MYRHTAFVQQDCEYKNDFFFYVKLCFKQWKRGHIELNKLLCSSSPHQLWYYDTLLMSYIENRVHRELFVQNIA